MKNSVLFMVFYIEYVTKVIVVTRFNKIRDGETLQAKDDVLDQL